MLYLLLTIALNAILIVGFKIFARLGINNLQAIVVNYWVCVVTGSLFIGHWPVTRASLHQSWLPWAMLMGAGFISLFNLIAYCTQKEGITITTIANKLSLVIPVAFALALYGEKMTLLKGGGLLLAIPAVYLSSDTTGKEKAGKDFWLALLLFCASGLMDTLVNYIAYRFFTTANPVADEAGQSIYLVHAFLTAGILGAILILSLVITGRQRLSWKNFIAGLLLGVPNFFSMYFFVRLLQTGFLPGSAAIPANNIGIVLMASLVAVLFFRERASPKRWLGMILSVAAILFIMLSDLHG